jgi:hypothetical protein
VTDTEHEDLRLRMKIWTDPDTAKRYLMAAAFMLKAPVTDRMRAYAMRDDDTKIVVMTEREWNELPYYYFKEDGPAPRAIARPLDVVL